MPGLDGLRALAVLAVLAYHLDIGWAQGGLLGVGVFFTLSGYLITDLLLEQFSGGGIRLGQFWLRRARRLLPALFVMLVVVTAWITLFEPAELNSLRGAVGSAAAYVSNWWLIFQDIPYVDSFSAPSPLGHLWSLAIEEQFYLVWPFVLLLGLRYVKEPGGRVRVRLRLSALTLALAAVSVALMALLYRSGLDSTRVYDGTDTRAFGLLIGAALAMVWPAGRLSSPVTVTARRILDAAGMAGLAVIGLLIWRTDYYSAFLYPAGLVLLSVATALVVAALAHPAARLGHALGWRPLRWIGVRSYGIYLWHFPVIALTTPFPDPGFDLLRATLQTAATIGLAALSWRYVEEPVRHGALGRLWRGVGSRALRQRGLPRLGWATATAAVAAVALAACGLAGVSPIGPASGLSATIPGGVDVAAPAYAAGGRSRPADPGQSASAAAGLSAPFETSATPTSCRRVVHVGDSTSEGLISHDYLPDRHQRIRSQYARVGATRARMEIEAATSIVETLAGGTNAYDVARDLVADGYRGCWVFALGTNDAADVYVGSSVDLATRIDRMMYAIGGEPALWLTARSLVGTGPYAEDNMQRWNDAVLEACSRYPNMRVFDWAAVARDEWFIDDGIHFTSPGYAARARLIAGALARAFPRSGVPGSSCVVG